ncbi:MAG TPA: HD domain-containing phosphohydrolase [Phycisphaerae bacterium]|nr:HD domain-containing phosphohydrolase [Phycisphaerae bacterium]
MIRQRTKREKLILELMLLVLAIGLACLCYQMQGGKMVVLNLYYLPVVLAGFFLGRQSAGVLTLFCVLSASVVAALSLAGFEVGSSPLAAGLTIVVWAAVLGLTALLVGTLSDDAAAKMAELHAAYAAVVEVLSRYLQSANPALKARSTRVAELCHLVGTDMGLPAAHVEDIRVAALLGDIGKIEVTAKLVTRAVDVVESGPHATSHETIDGVDLVRSLGSLLRGAVPILLSQDVSACDCLVDDRGTSSSRGPIGARIIHVVRAYDDLTQGDEMRPALAWREAVAELRADGCNGYDAQVVDVLERVVAHGIKTNVAPAQLARTTSDIEKGGERRPPVVLEPSGDRIS